MVWGEGDDQLCGSGRGAIAGCHCSVLWWGEGRVAANFGGVDVVLLEGAIVACYGRVPVWRPTLGEWTFHCRAVAPYTAMACRNSIQKNCLKLLADITLFSIHWYHKNWFLLSGVYAGIIGEDELQKFDSSLQRIFLHDWLWSQPSQPSAEKITRLGGTGIPPVAPMSKGAAAMRRAHHRRRKFWQFCWCSFLGWWKRDPFKGCWWPPNRGYKRSGLESPGVGYPKWFMMFFFVFFLKGSFLSNMLYWGIYLMLNFRMGNMGCRGGFDLQEGWVEKNLFEWTHEPCRFTTHHS